eukprot:TRINITY_DN6981_c0_g2_i1.p1 TRINITY_DN6981_c0_g2~~TRINITY_DN6981_c0_g2_i1.p1  ORF type:complete len:530 (+),score=99.10 TRINITY_DN6981_c0_g2_i1:1605-3194(+)
MMTTTVQTKSQTINDGLDDDAFHTIKRQIFEVLNDEDGQVMMVPIVVRTAVQLGEIKLFGRNGEQIDITNAKVHNPGGDNPSASQGPEGALKSSTEYRWVDRNAKPLIIEFPKPVLISKYTLKTAKDFSEFASEPVSWVLEGLLSKDAEEWILIDAQDGVTVPEARNADYPLIELSEPIAWRSIRLVIKRLSATQDEVTDISHVAGSRFRPGVHYTLDLHNEGHFVVIKVMGEHEVEFVVHMFNILQRLRLDIHKAKMYQTFSAGSEEPMSIKLLYCKDIESPGAPSAERLTEIRTKLTRQFAIHGIKGKAMVKTLRCDNAPPIYGFTPPVQEGEHVGEFIFVYRRQSTKKEVWCPLTAVLAWMYTELHFDIVNLAMDMDVDSKNSHATIFVKDPEFAKHSDQENVVCDLIDIFQKKGVPAHVSAHLHAWHRDQDMVTTNLGEAKGGFKNTYARISDPKCSVKSFQGEVLSLASPTYASRTFSETDGRQSGNIHAIIDTLRTKLNEDVASAVAEIMAPHPSKAPHTKPF